MCSCYWMQQSWILAILDPLTVASYPSSRHWVFTPECSPSLTGSTSSGEGWFWKATWQKRRDQLARWRCGWLDSIDVSQFTVCEKGDSNAIQCQSATDIVQRNRTFSGWWHLLDPKWDVWIMNLYDLNITSYDDKVAFKHFLLVNNKNLIKTFYNNSWMMKRTLVTFGLLKSDQQDLKKKSIL